MVMTTSRIGRVTKGRVFIYVVFGLFLVGLIACYKNASTLLEEAQKAYTICRQEQDNVSQQLHVVFDYKQRLEKTLQNEKAENVRAKTDYTNKLNEEKLKCDKINSEAKLRFTTLQQHYNILQTQHDDFKEECSKIQREQLDNINQLQSKLKEVQEELKRVTSDKDKSIRHVKAEKDDLEQQNKALQAKVDLLMKKDEPKPVRRTEFSSTSFNKLIPVGNAHYIVPEPEERPHENNENDAVLPLPDQDKPQQKVFTPKTSSKALNAALPLNAPSATPETAKSSTTKKIIPLLPIPYQNVPEGVVPAPNLNSDDGKDRANREQDLDMIDERFKAVVDKPDENKKDELKNQFNNIAADNENVANEVFDLPNNNNNDVETGKDAAAPGKSGKKQHIDELNADNNDGDYDAQNLIDEGEEGDDAADGANPLIQQDEAVRN